MAAAAQRRGPGLRGAALGRVRAAERPRADRRRRGARELLQARGRPPLRRPGRGPPSRRAGRGGAGVRQRHPAARERAEPCARCACRCGSTGGRCRRSRCSTCAATTSRCIPRRAWRWPTCAAPEARRSSCSTAAAGRTSSPAGPAAACGCAPTATWRWSCTAMDRSWPVTTAATASRCPSAAVRAARSRWPATGPGPSASSTSCARRWAPTLSGLPAGRGLGRVGSAGGDPAGLRRLRFGGSGRHPDGGQGPRLPRRLAGAGARCRPDPALPGLPGRGTDVRAGHPAGRPDRAWAAGRPGAGADPGARRPADPLRCRVTTRTASWPTSWCGDGSSATRPTRR